MRKFYKSKYVIEYLESIEIEGKKVKRFIMRIFPLEKNIRSR